MTINSADFYVSRIRVSPNNRSLYVIFGLTSGRDFVYKDDAAAIRNVGLFGDYGTRQTRPPRILDSTVTGIQEVYEAYSTDIDGEGDTLYAMSLTHVGNDDDSRDNRRKVYTHKNLYALDGGVWYNISGILDNIPVSDTEKIQDIKRFSINRISLEVEVDFDLTRIQYTIERINAEAIGLIPGVTVAFDLSSTNTTESITVNFSSIPVQVEFDLSSIDTTESIELEFIPVPEVEVFIDLTSINTTESITVEIEDPVGVVVSIDLSSTNTTESINPRVDIPATGIGEVYFQITNLDTTETIESQRIYASVYTTAGGLTILGGEHVLRKAIYEPTLYIALYTTDNDNAELSGRGYRRGIWTQKQKDIDLFNYEVINNSNIHIYTASDDNTPPTRFLALFDQFIGGDQLTVRVSLPSTPPPNRYDRVQIPSRTLSYGI